MIYFDVTKTGQAAHRSGLTRVSSRLRDAFGARARAAVFKAGRLCAPDGAPLPLAASDWFLTSELFSEEERPGFTAFLAARPCRLAAIFHDAIPLRLPHITWPRSVARHPAYMKALSRFDRVWAVSRTSGDELLGFWRWQGIEHFPTVAPLALGADFTAAPAPAAPAAGLPALLCVGILEPRKNQLFLLAVCEALWREGLAFELHVVGRVNPHFGAPIVARLKALQRRHRDHLHYHAAASDTALAALYASARAGVFPTLAEGCGLPLLESIARGIPCIHSDLPVLRENSADGGCVAVPLHDPVAWADALRRIVTDDTHHAALVAAARARRLPTWADTARTLLDSLV